MNSIKATLIGWLPVLFFCVMLSSLFFSFCFVPLPISWNQPNNVIGEQSKTSQKHTKTNKNKQKNRNKNKKQNKQNKTKQKKKKTVAKRKKGKNEKKEKKKKKRTIDRDYALDEEAAFTFGSDRIPLPEL